MVGSELVAQEIWPVVERMLTAVIAAESAPVAATLMPESQAADLLALFGLPVFDILLKTVLGRETVAVTRVVQTENGRYLHLEYAWTAPNDGQPAYTAEDLVTVTLTSQDTRWLVTAVNPSNLDLPLNSGRARAVLALGREATANDQLPGEAWILPYALYGGLLALPLQPEAMADEVEAQLLPGLQQQQFGVMVLVYGRSLWRHFWAAARPEIDRPAAWAAALTYLLSQQDLRETTPAAVAKQYGCTVTAVAPRIRQIQKALNIQAIDERYSDMQTTQIIYNTNE